jgi:hypothetical protein
VTSTAEIERALITALDTIRTNWDALVEPGSPGAIASKPTPRRLYTRDDTDERDDDLPPIDRCVAIREDVTASLNGWARIIVEDRNLTHGLPLGTDTLGLCELITRHAEWFSGHEAATYAADELKGWAGRVKAAANPQRREWMPIGTCPLEIDSENGPVTCAGSVRAYPGRDPQCQKCGTSAVATWWERVMFPDAETSRLVTADEIVTLIHRQFGRVVKPGTLRVWISRGWIEASGTDDKGRTLYDKGAVVYAYAHRSATG